MSSSIVINPTPTIEKNFIRSIILLPILFSYATPVPSLTLGDLYLVISSFAFVINRKAKYQKSLFLIIGYIITLTLCRYNQLSNPFTTLRYLTYLIVISVMPSLSAYNDYAFRLLSKVSMMAASLLILQYILLKTIGYCLPGVLTFMPLVDEGLKDYSAAVFGVNSGRCMSFFEEPSHFAIYMLPYIAITLFKSSKIYKKNIIIACFATLSVVLSASFTGVMCALIIWICWLFLGLRHHLFSASKIIALLMLFFIIGLIFINSSSGSYIINSETYERQSSGRFGGFEYVQDVLNSIDFSVKLYGIGMIDMAEEIYLSGWPRLFMYYGIFGSIVYIISFVSCVKFKSLSMILLCLIGGLMIGTEMNFGYLLLPYMLIIFLCKKGYYIQEYKCFNK